MIHNLVGFYKIFNKAEPDKILGYKLFLCDDITSAFGKGIRFNDSIVVPPEIVDLSDHSDLGYYDFSYTAHGDVYRMEKVMKF